MLRCWAPPREDAKDRDPIIKTYWVDVSAVLSGRFSLGKRRKDLLRAAWHEIRRSAGAEEMRPLNSRSASSADGGVTDPAPRRRWRPLGNHGAQPRDGGNGAAARYDPYSRRGRVAANLTASGVCGSAAVHQTRPRTSSASTSIDLTIGEFCICLLYTSPSPRDGLLSRMPSSA